MVKVATSNPGIPGFESPIEAYTNFVTYLSEGTNLDFFVLFVFPWLVVACAAAVRYAPAGSRFRLGSQGFLVVTIFAWVLNSFNMLLVEINGASFALEIGSDPYEAVLMKTGFLFITINTTWILLFVFVGLLLLIPRRRTPE